LPKRTSVLPFFRSSVFPILYSFFQMAAVPASPSPSASSAAPAPAAAAAALASMMHPNYSERGFPMLHWDWLPTVPLHRPPIVHNNADCREWIARRVTDPAMTKKVFEATIDRFWGTKKMHLCGTVRIQMEAVAQALLDYPGGTPPEGSPEWERTIASPTDEEWEAQYAECVKDREEARAEGCEEARACSAAFGSLTVRQIAAYYEERPDAAIWKAICEGVPHLKVQKAMEFVVDRLIVEGDRHPTYSPCLCEECCGWQERRWWHNNNCVDPHCCVQLTEADLDEDEKARGGHPGY